MRILCTAPFVPFPLVDGGRIVPYRHAEGLAARGHELTLLYPLRRPGDRAAVEELRRFGKAEGIPVRPRGAARVVLSAVRSRSSVRVQRHRFPEMENAVRAAAAGCEAAVLDSLFTAYLAPAIRKARRDAPIVLCQQNVESDAFRQRVLASSSPAWRLLALWEGGRIAAGERESLLGMDRVLTLSAEDRDRLRAIAPGAPAEVLGPGTVTYPGMEIPEPADPPTALYLGGPGWPPNRDAAEWLLAEIWPEISRRVPAARLLLAGHDPDGRMTGLSDPGARVEARGFVKDVAATTREAAVCLVPLRFGGGIRLKILEALANERAVVTTTRGVRGLPLEHGKHVIVEDDPARFAVAAAGLLQDREAARRLARAGRERVEASCSWDAVASRLESTLEGLARGR